MSAIHVYVEEVDDGRVVLKLMQPCSIMGDIHEGRVVLYEGDNMELFMETEVAECDDL